MLKNNHLCLLPKPTWVSPGSPKFLLIPDSARSLSSGMFFNPVTLYHNSILSTPIAIFHDFFQGTVRKHLFTWEMTDQQNYFSWIFLGEKKMSILGVYTESWVTQRYSISSRSRAKHRKLYRITVLHWKDWLPSQNKKGKGYRFS